MEVELTLKNYRCFSDENPVCISIRNGFTALVGVNNSGKSSLLRFFYEFRDLLAQLSTLQEFAALELPEDLKEKAREHLSAAVQDGAEYAAMARAAMARGAGGVG